MIQTAKELATAAKIVAEKENTLYVLGFFGWPMMEPCKRRSQVYAFNRQPERAEKIQAASSDTFGFDCVGLIKALLWGWSGRTEHVFGGASYASAGVGDINADLMMAICCEKSEDFSSIQVGEVLWNKGHIGIYIGDGLAVECTHRWKDGVQITAVHNMGRKKGFHGRTWTKHGKLPYVTYEGRKGDYTLELRNLKKGCRGADVKALQILLAGSGFEPGKADGIFGKKTEAAVMAYQKKMGLVPDAIAGKNTMGCLLGVKS